VNQENLSYIPINKGQFTIETPEREAEFERKRGFGVEEAYRENRRQWTEYPKKQYVADYPLHVDIELSSICNLRCPMCYTITEEFKKKVNTTLMDYDLFMKIVDECASGGVYSIRLSLRGEPFLHKQIVDCIRYAKQKKIKEVSTLTNGVRLNEEMYREIMDAGIDWITISFDGMGETYERIRHPAKFDRSVEKIRNYQKIKKESGYVKPVIKVQSVLPAIQDDLQAFYKKFAPISDMVSVNPLIDYSQDRTTLPKVQNFVCPQIFQRLVIGADGHCLICANDENEDILIGDAYKDSIYTLWHSNTLMCIRELHRNHKGVDALVPCRKCALPIATNDVKIWLDGRYVIAENYSSRQLDVIRFEEASINGVGGVS